MESLYSLVSDKVSSIKQKIIDTRRHIHMYPELSGDERETSQLVADRLKSFGLDVQTQIGGYGVVGILKGNSDGDAIAWRADMDASAMQDVIDKPYRSMNDGVKHVCGHDANTAIALGIAETLSSVREHLRGSIKFIFQPWEEGTKGALRMIKDGVLEKPRPHAVYGLHVTNWNLNQTYLRAGQLSVNYGTALFGRCQFQVTVKVHRDDIILSSEQMVLIRHLNRLNRYRIRDARPTQDIIDMKVVETDKAFRKNEILVRGAFRFAKPRYLEEILGELDRILDDYRKQSNYEVILEPLMQLPPVYNDEDESERAYQFLRNHIGDNAVAIRDAFPPHGGDDFAFFQNELSRGLFFFIGMANPEKGIKVGMHNPDFDIDEDCLEFGVRTMSMFLLHTLNES